MSRLMSAVSNFLHQHGRRDNLASLSEDIHRQAEQQDWDAEDNSQEELETIQPNPSGIAYVNGSGSYASLDPTFYSTNVNVSSYPTYSLTDGLISMVNDPSEYTFALANGQEIKIRLIDNNNAIEIEYDGNIMEPISDVGKITLRNSFDEENNASQDTRIHEEPTEDNSYSGTNVLQPGQAVFYTQQ